MMGAKSDDFDALTDALDEVAFAAAAGGSA
jgi:hypothetical protein